MYPCKLNCHKSSFSDFQVSCKYIMLNLKFIVLRSSTTNISNSSNLEFMDYIFELRKVNVSVLLLANK